MAEEEVKKEVKVVAHHPADTNGDGKVSEAEEAMYLEFKRKELEDADAILWLDYQKHRKHLVQWHQPTL